MSTQLPLWLSLSEDCFTIEISAQPQAKRTEIKGEHGGRLRIAVKAKPQQGAANKELVKFLAKLLDLKQSDIVIISGELSRQKRVRVNHPFSAQVIDILK